MVKLNFIIVRFLELLGLLISALSLDIAEEIGLKRNGRSLLDVHPAVDTYVGVDYFPHSYITGYFYKSDYSCTSYPPQVMFSFAIGVCYANTTSGQNFVLQANGAKSDDQLVVTITTYWDAKCSQPQSEGSLPGYPTLCVDQVFGGQNFYGIYKYSGDIPALQPAPGIDTRFFQTIENCEANGGTTLLDDAEPDKHLKPYLVIWESTETCESTSESVCTSKPYLSFGSMFFSTTQCTSMTSGGGYTPPRNFLACFPGSETVRVHKNGRQELTRLDSIRVGEKVSTAGADGVVRVSDVVAVPHTKQSSKRRIYFVLIAVKSGMSIRVTPDHLLVGGSCDPAVYVNQMPLILAGRVTTNSCLLTEEGLQEVEFTAGHWDDSYFTLVPIDEYVVVNGFIASPFSWSHQVGHSFYNIHRFLFIKFPMLFTQGWLSSGVSIFADLW